jgi:hypothetical protein
MLRQVQGDKIVGKFGVDGHADLKDLKDLQFGIYELRLDYEMLRQVQGDKIVGKFGVDGHSDLKD